MDNKGRISNLAEEKYQVLFGMRKAAFNAMLAVLESAYGEMRKKGGRRRKLSVLDMLIIYLGYYRDNRTMDNIAFDYGVHKQRISEAVGWVEQALVKDGTFALPSKRELQKAGAEIFARTRLLLGTEAMDRLAASRVAVIGVGGVGSYAVEALARGGVGSLLLVDHDRVDVTNINRQLQADNSVIGLYKTKLMAARAKSINPLIDVKTLETFCLPENIGEVLSGKFDYIIDAVDTVSAKLAIAVYCRDRGIPLISCMGAANKLEPTRFEVADIADTSVCPLCRVMRRELKKRGIKSLKVVYSREEPIKPLAQEAAYPKRQIPGSVSFVPPVAGMIAAGEAIKGIALRVESRG